MLARIAVIALFLHIHCSAWCQADSLTGDWTNGQDIYSGEKINDSIIIFSGGNLHEGGVKFAVRITDDHSGVITDTSRDHSGDTPLGTMGDKVTCKLIDGKRVLLLELGSGLVDDCLVGDDSEGALYNIAVRDKANFELCGRYINTATNKIVVFHPNETVADGLTASMHYTFGEQYDYPINVVQFDNGKAFFYEQTKSGLALFKAKKDANDDWEQGVKIMSLKKLAALDLSGKPELKGTFTFASTQILFHDILKYFDAGQLRLMRNEIFARHGYAFKSADLKTYFSAQDWYKPQFNPVDDQLTDLERLNIRLIESYSELKAKKGQR
jgi:hypothetical protein